MQQDYAEVIGVIVVSGLDVAQADELATHIKAQPVTATTGWGEPVPRPDGLAVQLRRGPMLGAWPADIRRTVRRVVGEVGTIQVETTRTVLVKRADYDVRRPVPVSVPQPDTETAKAAVSLLVRKPPRDVPVEDWERYLWGSEINNPNETVAEGILRRRREGATREAHYRTK